MEITMKEKLPKPLLYLELGLLLLALAVGRDRESSVLDEVNATATPLVTMPAQALEADMSQNVAPLSNK